jgi:glycosyltransferase involved in cell wall biosynthesis
VKKRVLIVHPVLEGHGGGQAVAAWTIQALRDSAELTLLTKRKVDCDELNRYFGTALKPGDFQIHYVPSIYDRIPALMPFHGELLKTAFLSRCCKRLTARRPFDVIISTNNEFDFGTKGIQYVHYPWNASPRASNEHKPWNSWPRNVDKKHWYQFAGSVALYWGICNRIGGISRERIRRNVTLANSEFIRGLIRGAYKIDSVVVHPPVPGGFPGIPWERRESSFVALGRQAPEKNWPQAVEILRLVRASGHPVRFTLIGSPDHPETERKLAQLAMADSDWFTVHTNLPREQMIQIIARHRYGIHAMVDEHFGIAVAEFQRAGCIPFVHRSGGPMEIAGFDDRLMFENSSEAAAKISRVLGNEDLQRELAAQANTRAARYTSETFMQDIRRQVEEFA